MDGESSYESDISESWSLIDINLNEESPSAAEAYPELEKSCQSDITTEETKERELEDFVRTCKESNKADFNRLSDSDSDTSAKNQELTNGDDVAEARGDSSSFKSSECRFCSYTEGLNDSSESIEIVELCSSNVDDSDINRFEVPSTGQFHPSVSRTNHSDDEESLEESIGSENRSNNSTVIRRRRRRVIRTTDESVNSVNSEIRSSAESNTTICPSDAPKESRQPIEEIDKVDGHPVYKHCRNNVANTILSLSVGIIVTGVACIAIGHFLGVQDAAETAVELSEALKKLHMENAALQSRLSNLNRALLAREANSKIELPLNEPVKKAATESSCPASPAATGNPDISNAALSEIRSSLNSIEWLSKVQDFIHKSNKVTDTDYGIDFSGFGKFIHDQLHRLNVRQEKFLEDTDKNISKVLHKIINRLSSSQDHIEKLFEKIIKLKNKLNHKIKNIFPESSKPKLRGKIPVTESDLQTMSWHRGDEVAERSDEVNTVTVFYAFPQPESYYKKENYLKETDEAEPTNSTAIFDYKNSEDEEEEKDVRQQKNKPRNEHRKKGEKMYNKENLKKKKYKEREAKEKKAEKRRKREAKKMHKMVKSAENDKKGRFRIDEFRSKSNQNVFNETIFQKKPHTKTRSSDSVHKLKHKKSKGSKLGNLLAKIQKKPNSKKKRNGPVCPGTECFNLTGNWVFKWAGAREEVRRNQALGDWQFDRAKGRKELRQDDDRENWQFKRALAREYNRYNARWRGKYTKYDGKDFFQEDFSWI